MYAIRSYYEFVNHHFAYAYALDCELAWGQALGGVLGDTLESFGGDDDIPSASRLIPSCTTSPFAGLPEDFDRAFGDSYNFV